MSNEYLRGASALESWNELVASVNPEMLYAESYQDTIDRWTDTRLKYDISTLALYDKKMLTNLDFGCKKRAARMMYLYSLQALYGSSWMTINANGQMSIHGC